MAGGMRYPGQRFHTSLIGLSRELHASISGLLDLSYKYEHLFHSLDRFSRLSSPLMLGGKSEFGKKWSGPFERTAWSKIKELTLSSSFVSAFERLSRAWNRVIELLKERDRAAGILVELGWPPHQDLSAKELAAIARIYDREGPERAERSVADFMLEHYGVQALEGILEGWRRRRWLQPRLRILEESISGHKSGLYFLTVPALFAQIEGIIAEGFGHRGRMKSQDYEKYLEQLLDTPLPEHRAVKKFMLDVVLASFVWGMQVSLPLSRHAILHGYDTRYGTKENSLKVILLFDYIQAKFGYVSVGNGRSYHDLSCPVVKGKPRKAIFEFEQEAEEAGKRPCSRCVEKVRAA